MMKIFILSIFSFLYSNSFSQVATWTWGRNAQGVSYDGAESVATDSDGNIYVTGYFYGSSINFGSFILNNNNLNKSDVFIVKPGTYFINVKTLHFNQPACRFIIQ